MRFFRSDAEKAEKLEACGDRNLAKGKFKKAVEKYREALKKDPTRKSVYDKITEARDKVPGNWEMGDFVESVSWAMSKQEQENPSIRHVHAMLSPDWDKARELAFRILACKGEEEEKALVEEFAAKGEVAARAAISILIEFKKGSKRQEEAAE